AHMGHFDFRANGRIFATLHTGDKTGMVKLVPDEQQEFMRTHRAMFELSPGAWGRGGSTTVILKAADVSTLRAASTMAWQHVMAMLPAKTRASKAVKPAALAAPRKAVRTRTLKRTKA